MSLERSLWFSHKIEKETWKIYVSDPLYERDLWLNSIELHGICLYDSKRILISANAPRAEWSSILLHEIVHARCPGLSEKTVLNVEKRLISALLPHWKPPPYPDAVRKLWRRVRRRTRRNSCQKNTELNTSP
jgi:hypothetical protein